MSPTARPRPWPWPSAALQPVTTAADLVDLGNASSWSVENVARLYHQVGAAFGFDSPALGGRFSSWAATPSNAWPSAA